MIIAEKRARIQKELNEIDDLYTRKGRGEQDEGEYDENNDEDETKVTKSTVQIVSSDANQENPPSIKGRKSPTTAKGTNEESSERNEESSERKEESSERKEESSERNEEGGM